MEQDPVQCLEQEGRFQMLDFQAFLSLGKEKRGYELPFRGVYRQSTEQMNLAFLA